MPSNMIEPAMMRQPGRAFSRAELIDVALGDDALVLRAGHAFEQATGYWKRRSSLIAGAKPAALDPKPWVPSTTDVPADIRATAIASGSALNSAVRFHVSRSGLSG